MNDQPATIEEARLLVIEAAKVWQGSNRENELSALMADLGLFAALETLRVFEAAAAKASRERFLSLIAPSPRPNA